MLATPAFAQAAGGAGGAAGGLISFAPIILIFAIMYFLMTKVAEGEVEVELPPSNVKVRVVKSTISQVMSKTEPAEA